MAIAKMVKIAAIVQEADRARLMKILQHLQAIEVRTLDDSELESDRVVDSDQVRFLEDLLDDVRSAQTYLKSYLPAESFKEKYLQEKPSLSFDELDQAFDPDKIKALTEKIWTYKRNLEEIDAELKTLDTETEFLGKWKNLKTIPGPEEQYRHTKVYLGTVPQASDNAFINNIKAYPGALIEEVYQTKEDIGLVMAVNLDQAQEFNQILAQNRFQVVNYPYQALPQQLLQEKFKQQELLRKETEKIRREMGTLQAENKELQLAEETVYAQYARQKAGQAGLLTGRLFAIEGWAKESQAQSLVNQVEAEFGPAVSIQVEDVKEEEYEEVPVALENHKLAEPFEMVTGMYGLPKYGGFDPTRSLYIYYWIFFGMMIADLGYGLLLTIGSFLALKYMQVDAGMKRNLRFFHYLGYSVIIWGLIYGSIFGEELPFHLISPTKDVITVLSISLGLGFVLIIHGLLLNTYLAWKTDKLGAIKGGLAWIVMLFGFALAALGPKLLGWEGASGLGMNLAKIAAIVILAIAIIQSKNKAAGVAAGLYDLYGVSGYLGDLVSFSRLMALGISGGSIALAFNILVAYLPPVARFSVGIFLIVFLQLFNFGLSILSAYVHSARLIFVEFFGKFYEAGGRAFDPLKIQEKHIKLK